MAEPIFVAQPGGGQQAVSGLSQSDVSAIVQRMSRQAESRTPVPATGSALATVSAMAPSGGGSTTAITSDQARSQTQDLSGRVQAASRPFVPELVAGYRDASGNYVPASFTRPSAGQMIPSTLMSATGEFDPALIEQDPRYRLLAEQRKLLEERKATAGQDVESAFVAREAALRGQQNLQAGQAAMQLARMGALGTTVSGMSYLQNLDRRHLQESYDLGLEKMRAVEAAKNALENQQFDLVEQQLELADRIQSDFETRKDKQIARLKEFREIADKSLNTLAATGYTAERIDQIDPNYLDAIDEQIGLPKGASRQYLVKAKELADDEKELQNIERAKKRIANEQDLLKLEQDRVDLSFRGVKTLTDIQNAIPAGFEIEQDGFIYRGWSQDGLQKGTQTDENGNMIGYWYNPITEQVGTTTIGKFASKDGWELTNTNQGWMAWNKNIGQLKPLNITPQSTTLESILPTGSVWGATTNRANAGQCGAVVNDLIGLGVADSWESKQAKVNKALGTSSNPLRVWDAVVFGTTKYGSTGHIGLINSIQTVPVDPFDPSKGTKDIAIITESNVNGDRKMTHNRQIELTPEGLKQADWTGFARGKPVEMLSKIGTDGFIFAPDKTTVKNNLEIITPEVARQREQVDAEERKQLNKLVPEDTLRDLNLPIGTKYSDLIGLGLKLPQKKTGITYEYKEGINPATGKSALFAINKADPADVQMVTIKPKLIGPTVPEQPIPTERIATTPTPTAQPFEIIDKKAKEDDLEKTLSTSERKDVRAEYPNIEIPFNATRRQVEEIINDYKAKQAAKQDIISTNKFNPDYYNTAEGQKVRDDEMSSRQRFETNQIVKDFNDVQSRAASVRAIIDSGVGGPADLALVYDFMKALDPNSVVREAEYDAAAKSGNIFKGIWAKYNGYMKAEGGFLPSNVRAGFLKLTEAKYDVKLKEYENYAKETREIARRQGLDPNNVVPTFDFRQQTAQQKIDAVTDTDRKNRIQQALDAGYSAEDIANYYGL